MKTVLITGAAGLVGQNLTVMLLKHGYKVIALDKNKKNLRVLKTVNQNALVGVADLATKGSWDKLFAQADYVVHLAAQIAAPSKKPFEKNNIDATRNVIAACEKFGVKRLVHMSSSVVISVAEDDYTETKREAEQLVKDCKIPHTILRPPLMYGLFDVKHLGALTKILEKTPVYPLPGNGMFLRQPLYVNDACKVVMKSIERKYRSETFNIIGHEKITYVDLIKIIAQEKGLKRLYLPLPKKFFGMLLDAYGLVTRITLFTSEQLDALSAGDDFPVENWTTVFKTHYTPFQEAIKEVYASPLYKYRDHMMSPHDYAAKPLKKA